MIARLLLIAFVFAAAFASGACSSNKSSASLYDEDSPAMRYHAPQAPGEPVGTHRYH